MDRVITLITDFGTTDGYVGAIKGVILGIAPQARLVDVSHAIDHGRLRQASFVLESILPFYPAGTIHLVVVDPGVGSSRRPIVVASGGALLVGPDNGAFEPVYGRGDDFRCWEIAEKKYQLAEVSRSFHGRDIFAPAAAYLALGIEPQMFGPPVEDPVRQTGARKKIISHDGIVGSVIHADHFGNLITDITAQEIGMLAASRRKLAVSLCGKTIQGVSEYYAQAKKGKLLALIGSTGRLEVAANLDSALETLGGSALDAEVTITKV